MRTSRTNGTKTYNYVYNGSQLTQITVGSNTLNFTYDAGGIPMMATYNGTNYYYIVNLQGDVMGIMDGAGNVVVNYTYDAWGKPLSITGSMADTLGVQNSLRYRGYVYDQETGYYYLQSRYYDPEIGRFINADAFTSTGQGFIGNNMYTYCLNNPVSRYDPDGWASISYSLGDDAPSRFIDLFFGFGGAGGGFATALGGTLLTMEAVNMVSSKQATYVYIVIDNDKKQQQEQKQHVYISQSKKDNKDYQYWEAYKIGAHVVVGKGLTVTEASIRVSLGLNIMCANQDAAKWILVLNGYFAAVGPEIHGDKGFYYHYHPNRHSHTHIWYYT